MLAPADGDKDEAFCSVCFLLCLALRLRSVKNKLIVTIYLPSTQMMIIRLRSSKELMLNTIAGNDDDEDDADADGNEDDVVLVTPAAAAVVVVAPAEYCWYC